MHPRVWQSLLPEDFDCAAPDLVDPPIALRPIEEVVVPHITATALARPAGPAENPQLDSVGPSDNAHMDANPFADPRLARPGAHVDLSLPEPTIIVKGGDGTDYSGDLHQQKYSNLPNGQNSNSGSGAEESSDTRADIGFGQYRFDNSL